MPQKSTTALVSSGVTQLDLGVSWLWLVSSSLRVCHSFQVLLGSPRNDSSTDCRIPVLACIAPISLMMAVRSARLIFFFPRDGQLFFFEDKVLLSDVGDDRVLVGEGLLERVYLPLLGLLGDVGAFLREDALGTLYQFLAPVEYLVRAYPVFVGNVRYGLAFL